MTSAAAATITTASAKRVIKKKILKKREDEISGALTLLPRELSRKCLRGHKLKWNYLGANVSSLPK